MQLDDDEVIKIVNYHTLYIYCAASFSQLMTWAVMSARPATSDALLSPQPLGQPKEWKNVSGCTQTKEKTRETEEEKNSTHASTRLYLNTYNN